MNFLKKLGTVVLKIVGIASGLMPAIQGAIPQTTTVQTVEDKLNKAFGVIVTAEQMFAATGQSKTGSDKLKAATPFVAALVQNVTLLEGKKPKDEKLFEDAVTRMTAAMADILNSFGE